MTPEHPPNTPDSARLLRRVRLWTLLFVIGLVLSGVTAIPVAEEVRWMVVASGAEALARGADAPGWAQWLVKVDHGLQTTQTSFPFLFYGTDWLAFGHLMIALVFVWAWKDPVRNQWLFTYGIVACVLVIPWAFFFGALRGIPWWWRLIDCSFGVFGLIPLWLCRRWVRQVAALKQR